MTTLISFYTKDWKYPQYAAALQVDCERLGVPYKIQCLESTGSYLKNTCLKPQFILDKLEQLKSPVLWVDCDASLLGKPVCDYGVDFAARRMPETRDRTWHVGTMWFNYTPTMIKFVKRWIENTGNLSDESALDKTWREHGHTIQTSDLPPEYFYIERRGQRTPKDTVIMHRISDSQMKKMDMPMARKKRESGEW
jgi:hypothetical protein